MKITENLAKAAFLQTIERGIKSYKELNNNQEPTSEYLSKMMDSDEFKKAVLNRIEFLKEIF